MVYMHPTAAYQKFSWKLLLTLSLASTYFALRQWFTFVPFSLTGFGVSLLYDFAQFQLNQFQTWAPRSASHHRTRHSKRTEPAPAVQKPASRRPTMPIQTFPAHPIKSSQERRIHTAIPTDRSEVAIESNLIESSPKFAGIQAAVRAVVYCVPSTRRHNLLPCSVPAQCWGAPPLTLLLFDLNLSAQKAQWWAHGEIEWAAAEKVTGHGTGSIDGCRHDAVQKCRGWDNVPGHMAG